MTKGFNWYGDEARLAIDDASDETLQRAAFLIEGLTKVNIREAGLIDTGFMINSVYAIGPGLSSYSQARGDATAANPDAEMAPEPDLTANNAVAAAGVGASYAIQNEIRSPFLFPALEEARRQMGGVVETVTRDLDLL
jgi:hypothetical protein